MKKHITLTLSLFLLAVAAFALGFMSPAYAHAEIVPISATTYNVYMEGCNASTAFSAVTGKPCVVPGVSGMTGVGGVVAPQTSLPPTYPIGCNATTKFSAHDGKPCFPLVPVDVVPVIITDCFYTYAPGQIKTDQCMPAPINKNPAISYWWGKVNQHTGPQGDWQTDADGVSGADLDKLTYCRKFYPNTIEVVQSGTITLNTWHDRGNLSAYTATQPKFDCIQKTSTTSGPAISYWWGKVNQHTDGQGVWQTDVDGVSGANLDKLTYCRKFYPATTEVVENGTVTINNWHDAGNASSYVATQPKFDCIQKPIGVDYKPRITVVTPNNGEIYRRGETAETGNYLSYNVQIAGVKSKGDTLVRFKDLNGNFLPFSTGGNGWDPAVANPIVESGSMQINNTIPAGKYYLVANWHGYDGINLEDQSDVPFTISSANSDIPSIQVISPNGGESFHVHESINVKWKTKNISSNDHNMHLVIANFYSGQRYYLTGYNDALNATVNDGNEYVTIPGNVPEGKYIVIVSRTGSGVGDYDVFDESDTPFSITGGVVVNNECLASGAPSIHLMSPNGGEVYVVGNVIPIKWSTCNIPTNEYIHIAIRDSRVAVGDGITVSGNTGFYEFTVPAKTQTLTMGGENVYKIEVSGGYNVNDDSDSMFTINPTYTCVSTATNRCANPNPYPDNGCTAATKFSATTGRPCAIPVYLENTGQGTVTAQIVHQPGCTAVTKYSATTGMLCTY